MSCINCNNYKAYDKYSASRGGFISIFFSIIICIIYLLLDSPDVAMTEAAIGACVSTIIFLVILPKIDNKTLIIQKNSMLAGLSSLALIYVLLLCGYGFIEYGASDSPLQSHVVSKHYIENTASQIGINSIVAAILASYRGFDTLGETLVIFTAGIIVTLILSYRRKNVEKTQDIKIND
jgi:multicomponent Na+:H+ antiporter subunit B